MPIQNTAAWGDGDFCKTEHGRVRGLVVNETSTPPLPNTF